MKHYVTFGQTHVHSVEGKTFDKDCVAVFKAETSKEGRELAFQHFGPKFCFHYTEEEWDEDNMKWYPRGYLEIQGGG